MVVAKGDVTAAFHTGGMETRANTYEASPHLSDASHGRSADAETHEHCGGAGVHAKGSQSLRGALV